MIWHVRRVVVIVLIALVGPMLSVEAASDGTVDHYQKISDTAGNCTAILNDQDYFGRSVAGIGDLDGDGVLDFAVSASRDDDGGTDRGAVYVLFLNSDGTVKDYQKISDTAGNFTAPLGDSDVFGCSVGGIGDLDSDGVPDLAVRAHQDDDGGIDRGAVYVLFLASILPSKGDVNRDGLIDLLDARLCLQIAQGYIIPTEAQQAAADVDGDVDLTDAEILSEYIIGIRSALP